MIVSIEGNKKVYPSYKDFFKDFNIWYYRYYFLLMEHKDLLIIINDTSYNLKTYYHIKYKKSFFQVEHIIQEEYFLVNYNQNYYHHSSIKYQYSIERFFIGNSGEDIIIMKYNSLEAQALLRFLKSKFELCRDKHIMNKPLC